MNNEEATPNGSREDAESAQQEQLTTRQISVRLKFHELGLGGDERFPGDDFVFEKQIGVDDMNAAAICQEAQELFDDLVKRLEGNLAHLG